MLDVVYNHSTQFLLVIIARDVYRCGDYDGDKMNCGHPMMLEYFRQATVYLFRTFNLYGFRFDDTQTVVSTGGWGFLGNIRDSLRKAANAEGRNWPYCVAENSATQPWDISNPSHWRTGWPVGNRRILPRARRLLRPRSSRLGRSAESRRRK